MSLSYRQRYIRENYFEEAKNLAKSGKYPDGSTIVSVITLEWEKARSKFTSSMIQGLDDICKDNYHSSSVK